MKKLKDIQKKIEKEKVKFYNVGLSTEALINGNDLFNIDNFIDFVHSQKINAVFGCELYEDAEDYLIIFLGCIQRGGLSQLQACDRLPLICSLV